MKHNIGNIAPKEAKNGTLYMESDAGKYNVGDSFEWTEKVMGHDPNGRGRRATKIVGERINVFIVTGAGAEFEIYGNEFDDFDVKVRQRFYGELATTENIF